MTKIHVQHQLMIPQMLTAAGCGIFFKEAS